MTEEKQKKKMGAFDLHLFGIDIHPLWGAGTGLALIILHTGLFSAFGAILFVASIVALIARALRRNK